jgi:tape measure domain-containing protein
MSTFVEYIVTLKDQISGGLSGIDSKVKQLDSKISGLTTALGGLAVIGLGKKMISLAGDMEQTNIAFEVMIGNAEIANQLFDQINQYANVTPFDNKTLQDSAKLMLNFGEKVENIMPNLQMLGDIAGGDANRMSSLTLAFSQMNSAGKLMGQDLLQMINVGFNPLQEISRLTGKSMAELRKQMEKGAISSDMVKDAFRAATSQGGKFYGMMDRQSKTFKGQMSTLIGTLQMLGSKIGEALIPIIRPLVLFLIKLSDAFMKNKNLIQDLMTIIFPLVGVIGAIILAIKAWVFIQTILNVVLTANPIGAIIIAITLLVSVIVVLWRRCEVFRGTIMGLWEVLKAVGSYIKDKFMSIIDTFRGGWEKIGQSLKDAILKRLEIFLEGLKGIVRAIKELFAGNFKQALAEAGKAAYNLSIVPLVTGKSANDVISAGKKTAELFKKGYSKGAIQKAGELGKNISTPIGTAAGISGSTSLASLGVDKGTEITGAAPKIFNITIQQLKGIENFYNQKETVKESSQNIGNAILEVLTNQLADIQLTAR